MEYRIEHYKTANGSTSSIKAFQFLLKAGTLDYNEHFHWERFE